MPGFFLSNRNLKRVQDGGCIVNTVRPQVWDHLEPRAQVRIPGYLF